MNKVNDLYNLKYSNIKDMYIIGTGPSLRLFPLSLLNDKFTIGLNNSHKFIKSNIYITIHPDLHYPFGSNDDSVWVSKYEKCKKVLNEEQFNEIKNKFYFYNNNGKPNTALKNEPTNEGRILDWLDKPTEDKLYQWSSISQTAINLAVNLGARNIYLVGCDGGPILGNDHVDDQHTRWKGVSPDHRYKQYRQGIAEIRDRLLLKGINILSLSPFISLTNIYEDFEDLCKLKNMQLEIKSKSDVSPKNNQTLFHKLTQKFFK